VATASVESRAQTLAEISRSYDVGGDRGF